MAIIEELGLNVKVQVNGSAAAEYPDEEPDVEDANCSETTKACHRYVESVDNTEFAIHVGLIPGSNTAQEWIGRSPYHRLTFSAAFDGGRNVISTTVSQLHTSDLFEGIHNRETQTLRKFRFAPVSTIGDADKKRITTDMKIAQNLGLIRVCVRRGIWKKVAEYKIRSDHGLKLGPDDLSLAEKALKGKAVSHGTALSAPVQSTRKSSKKSAWDVDWVDPRASPLAVFYLKYRSKEALQQELIITRPRSLSIDSDLGNLSPGQIHRLALERVSQMKDDKKRAVSVKDEDDAEVVKSDRPFKYVRIEGGKKAIDLTEDD